VQEPHALGAASAGQRGYGEDALGEAGGRPRAPLLADPPKWLAVQLGKCREDLGRMIAPTVAAIGAYLPDAPEAQEIRMALERYVMETR
jgi:hypothetical protein